MSDGVGYEANADAILKWIGDSTLRLACYQAAFSMGAVKRMGPVLELAERFARYAEVEPVVEPTQVDSPTKKRGRPKGSTNKKKTIPADPP